LTELFNIKESVEGSKISITLGWKNKRDKKGRRENKT
jgi:hypothetical protein